MAYLHRHGLLHGNLTAEHYEDATAADPRIDALRTQMVVAEEKSYTRDYLDPAKRSIANAVQVFFTDGSSTKKIAIEYPIGHRRRRTDGIPLLQQKAEAAFTAHYGEAKSAQLTSLFTDRAKLESLSAPSFAGDFVR